MSKYNNFSKEELLKIIEKQESELKTKKYGLVWDREKEPEQVVLDCENNIPILQRVKEKEIKTNDSDDNILIEGDNYHALTCLNYTHKGKIDVIYIDPPYNTGNKDFVYNDKYIDKEDGYRHSKWLNFMEKRLRLAKNLLSENGVIFISIDDNEFAQLKLLCDNIFGEKNFIGLLPRLVKKGGKSGDNIAKNNDYLLVYFFSPSSQLKSIEHNDPGFKYEDEYSKERGLYKLNQTLDYDTLGYVNSLDYEITINGESYFPGSYTKDQHIRRKEENPKNGHRWRWSKDLFNFGFKNGFIVVKQYKDKPSRIYTKTYQNATISKNNNGEYFVEIIPRTKIITSIDFIDNKFSNDGAKKELQNIFGDNKFDYPKPSYLIQYLLQLSTEKNSIILDFFAGSGTTGQAVLSLNKEDNGNRKFILCTNNDLNGVGSDLAEKNLNEDREKFGICQRVTYPRLEKVIKGYNKNGNGEWIDGLNGNLQYFKTDLIPVERIDNISDKQRNELSERAGQMIAIKENTFEEVETNEWYQIFENKDKSRKTAIYFREDMDEFESLLEKIGKTKTVLYVFSYSRIDKKIFNYIGKNVVLEDVPEPILEIYKEINLTLKESVRKYNLKTELERSKKHIEGENKEDGARVLRVCIENLIHQICIKNSIEIENRQVSFLNDELKRINCFDKIVWEKNKTFIAIGNNASHGDYSGFSLKDLVAFYDHLIQMISTFNINQ